jgi:His-Xaa-Ser system radical SAM maturase HxsC
MIALHGKATAVTLKRPLDRRIWRLADRATRAPDPRCDALLIGADRVSPEGFELYLTKPNVHPSEPDQGLIELPSSLSHLSAGDVIAVSSDGSRLKVLWRAGSRQNSILLTERCDNYCLMCSQPPKERDDSWLLEDAFELVRLLPDDTGDICLTGGEPTLYGDAFVRLLQAVTTHLPRAEVHVLSNGRRFADETFVDAYVEVDNSRLMAGIPIYGSDPGLHDFVVQAPGAFNETVLGIMNLIDREQRVEIRVVLQRHTAPAIVDIAEFISRNLPFVEQVALMGLEMTGLARPNIEEVWIDPFDYKEALTEATLLLHRAGIRTYIFNHQLCVIERSVWPFAVKSISDWKNEYDPVCTDCSALGQCGGFFHSASLRASSHIHPIDPDADAIAARIDRRPPRRRDGRGLPATPVLWKAGVSAS